MSIQSHLSSGIKYLDYTHNAAMIAQGLSHAVVRESDQEVFGYFKAKEGAAKLADKLTSDSVTEQKYKAVCL